MTPGGSGIVAEGDRRAGGRRLQPLAAWPPREVPSVALWTGCLRNSIPMSIALGLTLAGIMMIVVSSLPAQRGSPPPLWLGGVMLAAAVGLWALSVRHVRRVRHLLENGMAARVQLTRAHVSLLVHQSGRSRTTIEYVWSLGGISGTARQHGTIGRGLRAPRTGSEITVLYDPADPADQIVPLFFGFEVADG